MLLIAEIGVNHGGKVSKAMEMIDAAKAAGADAVKFQLFESRKLWGDDRIKSLELKWDEMAMLHAYCEANGIEFMCTPFGIAELIFLKPLLKRLKIASGFLRRLNFLMDAKETGLPIILSTGMADLGEVRMALSALGMADTTLLQCTSSYPCRLEDVNLKAMSTLTTLGKPVGLSDHTTSITVPIAAVALGATVIEKHFTLDRWDDGPDHKASITPKEFKTMRLAIIEVLAAMGDGEKRVMDCEVKLREQWK